MQTETLLTVYGKDALLEAIFMLFKNLGISDIPSPEQELLNQEVNPEKLMNVILAMMDLYKRRGLGEVITVKDVQDLIQQQIQQ